MYEKNLSSVSLLSLESYIKNFYIILRTMPLILLKIILINYPTIQSIFTTDFSKFINFVINLFS